MRTAGIIAEYNPFHRGHAWQIEEAKRQGAEAVLIVMSGDFVQRGEPAVVDKAVRARMALTAGADAVVELPPAYATGSAEIFARGAVSLAEACGCVDELVFGASCPDAERLVRLAGITEEESLQPVLLRRLREGLSYPTAYAAALKELRPEEAALLDDPNNLLAAEYLRAMRRGKVSFVPHPLPRKGASYGSRELPAHGFASATAIRSALKAGADAKALAAYLPDEAAEKLAHCLFADDLSAALSACLLRLAREGREAFLPYADVSEDLAARIAEQAPFAASFGELTEAVRTRAFSAARIRRALLHILLGIRRDDQLAAPQAIRILGVRKGSALPPLLKEKARLPLIAKPADADPALMEPFVFARSLYVQSYYFRHGIRLKDEMRLSPAAVGKVLET